MGKNEGNKKHRKVYAVFMILLAAIAAVIAVYFIFIRREDTKTYTASEDQYMLYEKDVSYDEGIGIHYVNNIILVFCEPGTSDEEKEEVANELNGTIEGRMDSIDQIQVRVKKGTYQELNQLCEEAKEKDYVAEALVDLAFRTQFTYALPNDPWTVEASDSSEEDINDEKKLEKWDVANPDGNNWWAEAINAPEAWKYTAKMQAVTVSVLDSGFPTDHEDLLCSILNPEFNVPDDHGTGVAGIIGATMNNERGLAGMAPNTDLLCYDIVATDKQNKEIKDNGGSGWNSGNGLMAGIDECIKKVGKDKHTVVNISWTNGPKAQKEALGRDYWTREETNEAGNYFSTYVVQMLEQGYDFVIVQSAGNGNSNGVGYNALNAGFFAAITEENCNTSDSNISPEEVTDRIIVVAGTEKVSDGNYRLARFSNYGEQVDIAAPGQNIFTTSVDGYNADCAGVSYSTPMVAGAAAVVWGLAPELTGDQIKGILCQNSDKKVKTNPNTEADSDDTYPLLNVGKAAEYVMNIDWDNVVEHAYEEYDIAAGLTTMTGNWYETMEMTADIRGIGRRNKYTDCNAGSHFEIRKYNPNNEDARTVVGNGDFTIKDLSRKWKMESVGGGTLRQYTEPQGLSPDDRLKQEFFDFSNIAEEMISSASLIVGNTIKFKIRGEDAAKIKLTAAEQLSEDGELWYYPKDDINVTVKIADEGTIESIRFQFSADLNYNGNDRVTDFNLKYTFKPVEGTPEYSDQSLEIDLNTGVPVKPGYYNDSEYEPEDAYCIIVTDYSEEEIVFAVDKVDPNGSYEYVTNLIHGKIIDGAVNFSWTDSWFNEGTGVLRIGENELYLQMEETVQSDYNYSTLATDRERTFIYSRALSEDERTHYYEQLDQGDVEQKENLSEEELMQKIIEHYEAELPEDDGGTYTIFEDEIRREGDIYSCILRYQMSEETGSEMIKNGIVPSANRFTGVVEANISTGEVTMDTNDEIWYLW